MPTNLGYSIIQPGELDEPALRAPRRRWADHADEIDAALQAEGADQHEDNHYTDEE
jgi:hypothetical protein